MTTDCLNFKILNKDFIFEKCKVWWQNSDMQVKNSKSGFHHFNIGCHNNDRGSKSHYLKPICAK